MGKELTLGYPDKMARSQPRLHYEAKFQSPFAVLGIRAVGASLRAIDLLPKRAETLPPQTRFAERVCRQLEAYLDDPDYQFDLPYQQPGTEFQHRVWQSVQAITRGNTKSYGEIARALRTGARAVGAVCGANQIPFIIPCHRVVSSQGLGGYMHVTTGEPLAIKRWLLRHEGAIP